MADEAEPLDQPWLLTARCKSCLYPLRDLSAPRCPECGRTFDPFDPHTMNAPGGT